MRIQWNLEVFFFRGKPPRLQLFSVPGFAMPYNFVCGILAGQKRKNVLAAKRTVFQTNGVVVFPFFDGIFEYFEIIEIFEYLVCFQ